MVGWIFRGVAGKLIGECNGFIFAMPEFDRKTLIQDVIKIHFAEWVFLDVAAPLLNLGEGIDAQTRSLIRTRDAQVVLFQQYIDDLDLDAILALCGKGDETLAVAETKELAKLRGAAFKAMSVRSKLRLVSLGAYPQYLANYTHWGMADVFSSRELLWLSVGLDPSKAMDKDLNEFRHGRRSTLVNEEGDELVRRLDLIERKFGNGRSMRISGCGFAKWVNAIAWDLHPDFHAMLDVIAARAPDLLKGNILTAKGKAKSTPDSREITSISKIITAIAIEEFGYQPNDAKGPIPKEIEAICDKAGLSVSKETILKFLRHGSKYLPDSPH